MQSHDSHATPLDALAQAILLELALCSDVASSGKWMREDAAPGAPSDPDRPPPGVVLTVKGSPPSLAAHYLSRYVGCRNDEQRRAVLWDAISELRKIRYAAMPKVDLGTLEGRLALGRDTRPIGILVDRTGYSRQHIWRLRVAAAEFDRRARFRPTHG